MGTNYRRSQQSHNALNQKPNTSARLNPECDGWFFSQKDRRLAFERAIVEVFNNDPAWSTYTAGTIIDYSEQLVAFSARVFTDLAVTLKDDEIATDKLALVKSMDQVDSVTGFSFCNHVAKRLLLLRKDRRLRAKKAFNGKRLTKRTEGVRSTTIRSAE